MVEKQIIATEKIYNEDGLIVAVKYHHEDGTHKKLTAKEYAVEKAKRSAQKVIDNWKSDK